MFLSQGRIEARETPIGQTSARSRHPPLHVWLMTWCGRATFRSRYLSMHKHAHAAQARATHVCEHAFSDSDTRKRRRRTNAQIAPWRGRSSARRSRGSQQHVRCHRSFARMWSRLDIREPVTAMLMPTDWRCAGPTARHVLRTIRFLRASSPQPPAPATRYVSCSCRRHARA
jgi:hypothetical protein